MIDYPQTIGQWVKTYEKLLKIDDDVRLAVKIMQVINTYDVDASKIIILEPGEDFIRTYLPEFSVEKFFERDRLIITVDNNKFKILLKTWRVPINDDNFREYFILVDKSRLYKILTKILYYAPDKELLNWALDPYLVTNYDRSYNKEQLQRFAIMKALTF